MTFAQEFQGYRRPDGQVGIRNRLAVIAAMDNVNPVARRIASLVREAIAVTVPFGRGQTGLDKARHDGALAGLGRNPNFGAALVVSLEPHSARALAEAIAVSGKPVEWLAVQPCGGTLKATEQGVRLAARLMGRASAQTREPIPLSELVIGAECGGSDTTSGITANPLLGMLGDCMVDAGATWILSETEEVVGAEHSLIERAASPDVAARMKMVVKRMEDQAIYQGTRVWPMSADNIAGGLTTLEEKALGNVRKGGTRPLGEVLEYGERPSKRGLVFLDAPAPGTENITALSVSGAQMILFTTGVGNPVGSPVSPTVKITGNPSTADSFADNIDVDLGGVISKEYSMEEGVEKLGAFMMDVASGRMTQSEMLGDMEIVVSPVDVSFLTHYHPA